MKTRACLAAVSVLMCISAAACAAPTVLWSIGQKDNSGKDLGLERKHDRFAKEVPPGFSFKVGTDPASKWPFIHAGPIDRWAKETTHPITVQFELPEVPRAQCTLVINTLGTYLNANQRLQAVINGNATVNNVPKGGGDEALYDESKVKPAEIRFEFFPELLRQGANEIQLTILEGAWMLYDNVQLEVDETAKPLRLTDLRVDVTPCFTTAGKELAQVLRCSVTNRGPAIDAQFTSAQAAGQSAAQNLRFGTTTIDFLVQPVTQPTSITVELVAASEALSNTVSLTPQRKWKVFAVPSIHTDIGYTHTQEEVFHRHNTNMDKVVEMCRSNPLFKWSIEVAWEVQNYFNDRSPAQQQELVSLMKQGRLGLNGGYLNMLTALMSDEAMNHYVYYAADLRRKHGIEVNTSLMTDIPSATRGLASAMAASGVRYFSEGCNQDRGPTIRHGNISTPFWWQGPDGARVLTWLSEGYAQSSWLAQAPDVDALYDHVAGAVRVHERRGDAYPFDAAYVYGAFLDNWEVDTRYGALLKDWNARYAYPQIIVSRGPEFFQYLEQNFPDKIPTHALDFGAYWEDGAGSTQKETTIHMENQRRITTAEILWSMARLNGAREPYPLQRFQKAWEDIIFYAEHTWGAAQSISSPDDPMTISQWNVKAEYAHRPNREIGQLYKQGVETYVNALPSSRPGSVVVFNPSNWPRSGAVPIPAGIGRDPRSSVVQRLERKAGETESTGSLFVDYLWVENVPPLGTKVVEGRIDQPDPAFSGTEVKLYALENQYYRIELSTTAGISSIVDKETGVELLDTTSPYAFGQVVYASGGEGTRMIHPDRGEFARFELNGDMTRALTPTKGTVRVTPAALTFVQPEPSGGQLFSEATIRAAAPGMQHVTTYVRLHNRQKQISLDVHIHGKKEIRTKEAVYIAFPFAGSAPKFRLGMTNAIHRPDKDFARGACHEWYCVQDFVSCADEKRNTEVVWTSPDVPLVCLSQLNQGRWIAEPELTTATIFSYAMNNYWHTNYKAGQGGDFHFRYDITSGKAGYSNEQCLRFARESAIPMIPMVAGGKSGVPARLDISGSNVVVGTIKGAEDGKGVVVRVRNVSDAPTSARIRLHETQFSKAELLNLVEDPDASVISNSGGEFSLPLKAQQVATVRLH